LKLFQFYICLKDTSPVLERQLCGGESVPAARLTGILTRGTGSAAVTGTDRYYSRLLLGRLPIPVLVVMLILVVLLLLMRLLFLMLVLMLDLQMLLYLLLFL
jgi:hypothetical protein